MNRRTEVRYSLIDESIKKSGQEKFFFEIDDDTSIRGIPDNINLRGLGMIIKGISSTALDKIKEEKRFFIRLYLAQDIIITGIRPVWITAEFNKNGTLDIKAGCRIEIISPDDRVKLSSIIERIRSAG